MNKFNISILFLGFALAVGCAKPEIPSHSFDDDSKESADFIGNGDYTTYTDINGTAISAENNAVGLVYDAETKQGIAGVPVTDENGVYQMKANRYCRLVYLSVPSEYEVPMSENNAPLFYSTTDFNRKYMNRNDFALKKLSDEVARQESEHWTLVAIGDPQCAKMTEHDRYVNETLADLRSDLGMHNRKGEYPHPYALTLGDVTSDAPELFPDMAKCMSNFKVENRYLPFFQCIGNHDHDVYLASVERVVNRTEYFHI